MPPTHIFAHLDLRLFPSLCREERSRQGCLKCVLLLEPRPPCPFQHLQSRLKASPQPRGWAEADLGSAIKCRVITSVGPAWPTGLVHPTQAPSPTPGRHRDLSHHLKHPFPSLCPVQTRAVARLMLLL